jgi:hypothetical protein
MSGFLRAVLRSDEHERGLSAFFVNFQAFISVYQAYMLCVYIFVRNYVQKYVKWKGSDGNPVSEVVTSWADHGLPVETVGLTANRTRDRNRYTRNHHIPMVTLGVRGVHCFPGSDDSDDPIRSIFGFKPTERNRRTRSELIGSKNNPL